MPRLMLRAEDRGTHEDHLVLSLCTGSWAVLKPTGALITASFMNRTTRPRVFRTPSCGNSGGRQAKEGRKENEMENN